jgi:high-affinity nickel-transport protein
VRHAADADHVLVVTTLVQRERSTAAAALIALLCGLGHALTVAVAGGAIVLFGIVVPERLGLSLELAASLTLVAVGALALRDLQVRSPALPVHRHGDYVHRHAAGHGTQPHGHRDDDTPLARTDALLRRLGPYRAVRPLVVGAVHGLAGSAAVALLALAAMPSLAWALAYLAVFGLGTIAGMVAVTMMLAAPLARLGPPVRLVSGVLSVGIGLAFAYRIVLYGLATTG